MVLQQVEGTTEPYEVTLLLHRYLREENAVEVSLTVEARQELPESASASKKCLALDFYERSPDQLFYPQQLAFECKKVGGRTFYGGQSKRFAIPAHQSVAPFPFDDIEIVPAAYLATPENNPTIKYQVAKLFPDRTMRLTGNELNWEVTLERSVVEQTTIVISALLFIFLAALVAVRLVMTAAPISGTQGLLTLAGYIVAAVGFRDMLGLAKSPSSTGFELVVFVLPLCLLSGVMVWRNLSDWITKRQSRQ